MPEIATAHEANKGLTRPLRVLVPLIKEDLQLGQEASERAGMPYYAAAGEKLCEARGQMSYSETIAWSKRNFGISRTQTDLYMSLAKATPDLPSPTTLEQFRREHLGQDRSSGMGRVHRDWREPVDEVVDRAKREAERIRDENLSRAEEREAQRTLALRLIDIGFKVLSKELHPDKGGSREAMTRLNQVRDRLKLHA